MIYYYTFTTYFPAYYEQLVFTKKRNGRLNFYWLA